MDLENPRFIPPCWTSDPRRLWLGESGGLLGGINLGFPSNQWNKLTGQFIPSIGAKLSDRNFLHAGFKADSHRVRAACCKRYLKYLAGSAIESVPCGQNQCSENLY